MSSVLQYYEELLGHRVEGVAYQQCAECTQFGCTPSCSECGGKARMVSNTLAFYFRAYLVIPIAL
jgi:hypothetical protein